MRQSELAPLVRSRGYENLPEQIAQSRSHAVMSKIVDICRLILFMKKSPT
jgi:hypothetical protein